MVTAERHRVTYNFPHRFRILWASVQSLLHEVANLRTMASNAVRSSKVFEWPNDLRRNYCDILDSTRYCFLSVRHEATSPWVHVTKLLSFGERTEWAINVLLEIQRLAPESLAEEQQHLYGEARDALAPLSAEDRAVMLESIHAEIRVAASQITPRFDPASPHEFVVELFCAKNIPALPPAARKWIEGSVVATEQLLDSLTHPAAQVEFAEYSHLDFSEYSPLSFVPNRGLYPVDLEEQCVFLREILGLENGTSSPLPVEETQRASAELDHATADSKAPEVEADADKIHTDHPSRPWEFFPGQAFYLKIQVPGLTKTQLAILQRFVESRITLSLEHLADVWDDRSRGPPLPNTKRTHISNLRAALVRFFQDQGIEIPGGDPIPEEAGGYAFALPRNSKIGSK